MGSSGLHVLFHLWDCQFLFQLFIVLCSSLITLLKIYWHFSQIILPKGHQTSFIKVVRNSIVKWTNRLGLWLTFKKSLPVHKHRCLNLVKLKVNLVKSFCFRFLSKVFIVYLGPVQMIKFLPKYIFVAFGVFLFFDFYIAYWWYIQKLVILHSYHVIWYLVTFLLDLIVL